MLSEAGTLLAASMEANGGHASSDASESWKGGLSDEGTGLVAAVVVVVVVAVVSVAAVVVAVVVVVVVVVAVAVSVCC